MASRFFKTETPLDTRAELWAIILDADVANPSAFNINNYFSLLKDEYKFVAMILHDEDLDNDKDRKTIHMHVCLETHRTRKESLINSLTELLGLPKNCISAQKCISERGYCRYLIHLDEDDKSYHYPPFLVKTNDSGYYLSFLTDRVENIYEEKLIEIVREERTTAKILLKIGLDNYRKYSKIISDLLRSMDV